MPRRSALSGESGLHKGPARRSHRSTRTGSAMLHLMGALGVAAGVALLGVMGGGPPEAPAPERPEQTVSVDEATIAIQPLGRIPDALLARQVRLIEARFGQHVRVLPARALPSEAWHPQRKQYRAGAVLDMLYVHKPTDVTHVVGLTLFDLYEDGWEYLYGFSQVH